MILLFFRYNAKVIKNNYLYTILLYNNLRLIECADKRGDGWFSVPKWVVKINKNNNK